jgi:hypothetical protein
VITYFGIARSDDTVVQPVGVSNDGVPIFERSFGSGFSIVVEGRRGGSLADVGRSTFDWNPADPTLLPDFQALVSRPLGNGSGAVCDDAQPAPGGVPETEPPIFATTQAVANAINDFTCRFKDGLGLRRGRDALNACTSPGDGTFAFVHPSSTVQFCGLINDPLTFPEGDTRITFRIRDEDGNISASQQLIIRITPP